MACVRFLVAVPVDCALGETLLEPWLACCPAATQMKELQPSLALMAYLFRQRGIGKIIG
jgi:hypothetical protein